mgnify:CR=1 FL=1
MGAPVGNCNAAKNKSACKANKGWYRKSGSRKNLKHIWIMRQGGSSVSAGAKKYLRATRSNAEDQQAQLAKIYANRFKAEMRRIRRRKAMGG